MKALYYIGIVCVTFWLGSCTQDDTVDTFKELNQVSLDGLKEKYSVMLYDYLKISLPIETTQQDEAHLAYVWYLSMDTTRYVADTLSKERDLNVLIDPSHATPGGDYTLTVKVIDQATGVYYRKDMQLEVLTEFTKGTVLLCEENGEAELNFLKPDDERTFIENIYMKANRGERLGKNPLRIYSLNPSVLDPEMKQQVIMCQDENGGVVASPVSFEKIKSFRELFTVAFQEPVLNPQLYIRGVMIDYMMVNGQVCRRALNMHLPDFETPQVVTQGEGTYEAAPFVIAPKSGKPIFFDRKHKRLLCHDAWNFGTLHQLNSDEAGLAQFDCSRIGENMEMLCCGNLAEEECYWMLMKDAQIGEIFVYKFKFISKENRFVSMLRALVNTQAVPHIYEAICFAANEDYPDVLMFATKECIYSVSMNGLTNSSATLVEAEQVNLSEKNMEITGFKFVTIDQETSVPGETRKSIQLRICVHDNSRSELKGGIIFYEVNSQGGIHSDYLFDKSGFCDTVVDIDEKYS